MSVEREQNSSQEVELKFIRDALQADAVSPDDREKIVRLFQDKQQKLDGLEEQLRKQKFDFSTVMEMTNQIIARSVDSSGLDNFISYIRSTFQGHFGVEDVYIVYRKDTKSDLLSAHRSDSIDLTLQSDSELTTYLSERKQPVSIQDLSSDLSHVPEVQKIADLDIELVLGLNRRMNTNESHLQGVLLLGSKVIEESYSKANKQFLSLLGRMIAISLHNAALYQKGIHDALTGLYNRGYFNVWLNEKIDARLNSDDLDPLPLSIILMDLDHFKRFNDDYGHQTGDEILQSVTDTLQKNTRPEDCLARYGGEEFIVCAPDSDRQQAKIIAERLRNQVSEMTESVNGKTLDITLSAGVSTFPSDAEKPKKLIAKADEALYNAKQNGRNTVVVAQQ